MRLDTLSPTQWAILSVLHRYMGHPVSLETISFLTEEASGQFDRAAPRKSTTIYVHVFNIREKLGDGVVITVQGSGYALGEPGYKLCAARRAAETAFAAALA